MLQTAQLTPLAFVRKRFAPIAAVFGMTLVLALAVVSSLPSQYRSWATILLEGRVVQMDILKPAVAGYLQEHISSVEQRVLSRENLMRIIEDFGLYPRLAEKLKADEIVERMRKDIIFETTKASTEEQQPFGQIPVATYTVRIAFQSPTPQTAASVAIVLLNLFMEESSSQREGKARTTYLFLRSQLAMLKSEIDAVEGDIARFKKGNIKSLPELMNMNLLAMERVQKDMDGVQMELNLARERKLYLEGQVAIQEPLRHMATTEGQKVLSLDEQIRQMRNQYLALRAAHSDKHPDVIQLSRRLKALEGAVSSREQQRSSTARLDERRNALAELRKKYSPQHPDVVALDKEVALLAREAEGLSSRAGGASAAEGEGSPDNPVYITLSTQLAQAKLEIEAKEVLLASLADKYEDYRRRIEETPGVEQEFIDLRRKYDALQISHRDFSARMQSAREATEIEARNLGEKLTVLEAPVIPERPFKPDRPLLAVLSLVISLSMGLLAGFAVEQFDPSVHGAAEVAALTGLPVLGVTPSLRTAAERAVQRRRRRVALLCGLAVLLLGVAAWTFSDPLVGLGGSLAAFFKELF